ncbi:hypothetical protein DFP73DRAFT_594695 [Morchella snyderi]|nr:hypothetical protein DFP73DRAFT_594695 [Morchella snyderi]
MSLWQYYRNLTPQTRALVGAGVVVYATAMLYISDAAEKKLDLVPTEEDKRRLEELVPKVRAVERREK